MRDIHGGTERKLTHTSEVGLSRFNHVRYVSELLCQPLMVEDYCLQAMADTSPIKWHLAHTSWFFETFILKVFVKQYQSFHPQFEVLFNSYYNAVGQQFNREKRHILSRPSVDQVYEYRAYVNDHIQQLASVIANAHYSDAQQLEFSQLLALGCHHEQQHQELMLTDLKYCWFQNPLYPAYQDNLSPLSSAPAAHVLPKKITFKSIDAGLYSIGHSSHESFCFDNETPQHQVYIEGVNIAERLITNEEYLAFIDDGGYENPLLWLSQGWSHLQQVGAVKHPLYWVQQDEQWFEYHLYGLKPLDLSQPVIHVNAYEADAFSRWLGCRLPTEFEWEIHQTKINAQIPEHNFLNTQYLQPTNTQLVGNAWQWTRSAYSAYPKYKAAEGAIGEYNGKFMVDQLVLRGGSCATAASHYRHSYRNFFYAKDKWQFSGISLAQDIN